MSDHTQRHWHPRLLLAGLVTIFTIGCVVLAVAVSWYDRQTTLECLEKTAQAHVRQVTERAGRVFDMAELILSRAETQVIERGTDVGQMAALAADAVRDAAFVGNLYVLDRQGRVVFDGKGFHPAGQSLVQQDWVRAGEESGLSVGAALFDQASRSYSFPIWRSISDASGLYLGKVAVLVRVEYFADMPGLEAGTALSYGLASSKGGVIVRQPWRAEDMGRDLGSQPLFQSHLSQKNQGSFVGPVVFDGPAMSVAYALLPDRQVVVWAALGQDRVLDDWYGRTRLVAGVMGLVLMVLCGLSWWLVRGIDQERKAAQAIRLANRDLARSNADLEQFAYIASHDLKEPLRNIASYVQLLQRRYHGRLDADADAFICYTVDGVTRLQSIISELLAYSRIGTGEMVPVPCQTGILVSTALTHLKTVIAEAQAVVDVAGPLPVVMADAALLGSLFQNLIANALKYRKEDVRPVVEIGCQDGGVGWNFYIRDNGIGIDPQYHRQIFDLFKRLHTKDKYVGTGIGLAICSRVVERHGGRIWVESEPLRGATFWFTLPKL